MIHICYCGNRKIFPLLALSILSVIKYEEQPITFHILTMELTSIEKDYLPFTPSQGEILDEIVKEKNPQSQAIVSDVSEYYVKYFDKSANGKSKYTPYAYLRLLIDVLPQFRDLERLIYLDIDTMSVSAISQLWDIDLKNYEFAAAKDVVGSHFIRPSYCNSGIMYINLNEIRKTDLFAKARKRVKTRKMIMPDQSSLNFLAKRKLILPRKFNEQRGIRSDTVVKHFCKGFKWYGPFFRLYNYKQNDRQNVHEKLHIYEFDDIYEQYDRLQERYDFEA